jgi:hypothetical protein
MKTKSLKILFFAIAIAYCNLSFGQTIRIANNNPGATTGTNVYTGPTALQLAINAAVSGDIIHVIPSSTSYGDIQIPTSLTILGIGLNPQKNIGQRSIAGTISLNGATSSGTRISGMHFGMLAIANTNGGYTVSNILCENNQMSRVVGPGFLANSISNIIVRNCIFNSSNNTGEGQAFEIYTNSGFIITNNIIRGNISIQGDGLTVQNNLFYYSGTSSALNTIFNCNVQNNIFYGCSPAVNASSTGNTFSNNMVFGSTNDTFTNGINANVAVGNIVANPMLTNLTFNANTWNYSQDITLLAGSPAIDAGLDGTDIGPSGGATPFDPEGTFLPLIQTINVPAVVTQGTDLEVNIKAKGN